MLNIVMNKRFFRDKTKSLISPEHLDYQFNKIADYINIDLIPYIENIITTATNGVPGDPLSVFSNIDNGTVGYDYIRDIHVDNNLIALNKLQKVAAGSVLGSDYEGNVIAITPEADDMLLFRDFLTNVIFRKIGSDDIANSALTGLQLGALASENFTSDTFIDVIPDGSIEQNKLNEISNDKIATSAVEFRHIGSWQEALPYTQAIAAQVLLSDFDDNSIDDSKIRNATIAPANFIDPQYINAGNIKERSIVDGHFKAYAPNTQPPNVINLANLIASNLGAIINFPDQAINVHDLKLPRGKIALDCLGIEQFDQEIQNAVNTYIQIKNQQAQPQPQAKKTRPDNFVKLGQFTLDPNIRNRYEQNGATVRTSYIEVGVATYPSGYLIYTTQQNIAGWMLIDNGDTVRFLYYNTKKNLEPLQQPPDYTGVVPISYFVGAAQAISKYSKRASNIEFYNFPY